MGAVMLSPTVRSDAQIQAGLTPVASYVVLPDGARALTKVRSNVGLGLAVLVAELSADDLSFKV